MSPYYISNQQERIIAHIEKTLDSIILFYNNNINRRGTVRSTEYTYRCNNDSNPIAAVVVVVGVNNMMMIAAAVVVVVVVMVRKKKAALVAAVSPDAAAADCSSPGCKWHAAGKPETRRPVGCVQCCRRPARVPKKTENSNGG